MNINAINQMMMNKNLKFRANEVPQEPQKPMGNTPEGPVTKPGEGLNALANNNIAFQGLNLTKVADKMGPAARKTLLPLLGAAMLAPAAVSCTKEPILIERPPVNVEVNTTVNVDMSQITALLDYLKESNRELFEMMNKWFSAWQQGEIDDAAFQEQVINFMLESKENQKVIIDLMVQNGKTEEEAKDYLEQILEEVRNGNMTAADAYKQIMEELGDINLTLKEGLNKLFEYMQNRDDKLFNMMADWKADYDANEMSEKEFNMMMYASIVTNQEKMIELLVQNGMSMSEAKAYLEKIVAQLGKVDENQETIIDLMVQNGKTEKEALAYLEKILAEVQNGNMTAADAYKQILEELGDINLTLKEGLNKLIEYMQGRDDKLFNIMADWKADYDKNEMAAAEYREKMLALISENRDIMLKVLEEAGMSKDEALAYLEKIVAQLSEANAKLDSIYEEIKAISADISKISEKQTAYHNQYMEMAKDADADREKMTEKLDLANYYLKNLNLKVDEQNKLLENLGGEHGNITIEQLKELWGAESEKWMNFFEAQHDLYFGELAESLSTTNYILALSLDELIALNKKVMEQNELILGQRNRLDQILAKIDWNTAETLGVAEEIRDLIAQFEFNCNCTCNGQGDKTEENEGILGDLDNLVNGNN